MKRKSLSKMFLASILLTSPLAGSAASHPVTWSDEEQADDESRGMEIREVLQSHRRSGGAQIDFTVTVYETITDERLAGNGGDLGIALRILFNLDRDPGYERQLAVIGDVDGNNIRAEMRMPRGKLIGYAHLTRPDEHSVGLTFPASYLGKKAGQNFRWLVGTSWEESCGGGCEAVAYDYAPHTRYRLGHT